MTDKKHTIDVETTQLSNRQTQGTSLLNVANLMPAARENRRNVTRALEEAIAIVSLDEESAKECFYSLPRGGKKISGPSIGLAETLASTWGNLVLSCDHVEEYDTHIVVRGWIVDTQSGLASQDMVRRNITKSNGDRFNEDMIGIATSAARSILYRNLVLRVIPRPHVRKVYNAAQRVAIGDAETWPQRVGKMIAFWEKKGVSKARLLIHLGKSRVEEVDLEDLTYLVGLEQSIRAGDMAIDKIFARKPDGEKSDAPKNTSEATAQMAKAKMEAKTKTKAKPKPKPKPKPEPEPEPEPEVDVETGEILNDPESSEDSPQSDIQF